MNRRDFLRSVAVAAAASSLPLAALAAEPTTDEMSGLVVDPVSRSVEIFRDGGWVTIPWTGLKKGMVFRLRESDGTLVDEGAKTEVSVAVEDAQPQEAPIYWGVKCEPFTFVTKDDPPRGFHVKVVGEDGIQIGLVARLYMSRVPAPAACREMPEYVQRTGLLMYEMVPIHNIEIVFAEQVFQDLTIPA